MLTNFAPSKVRNLPMNLAGAQTRFAYITRDSKSFLPVCSLFSCVPPAASPPLETLVLRYLDYHALV